MKNNHLKEILFFILLISGCATISSKDVELKRSVDSVKIHLKSKMPEDTSYSSIDCDAMKDGDRYYVLCNFDREKNEWGNHSMYVLDKDFEIIEIIPGR